MSTDEVSRGSIECPGPRQRLFKYTRPRTWYGCRYPTMLWFLGPSSRAVATGSSVSALSTTWGKHSVRRLYTSWLCRMSRCSAQSLTASEVASSRRCIWWSVTRTGVGYRGEPRARPPGTSQMGRRTRGWLRRDIGRRLARSTGTVAAAFPAALAARFQTALSTGRSRRSAESGIRPRSASL
jgi:hypothetical protein